MTSKILQIKNQLVNDIKNSLQTNAWFYKEHLLVVEKLALDLCKLYPEANQDAVALMVWFHDIGRAHGHHQQHDLYGANYAKKILTENNFDKKFIDLVVNACKTHSCDNYGKPTSLEGKILATADAMSHFHNGFYLRIFHSWTIKDDSNADKTIGYHKLKEKLFAKMDRDLNEKIFFEEAKKAMKPHYLAWQKIIKAISL